MTRLEVLWMGKSVFIHSIRAKSGVLHHNHSSVVGRKGIVLRESKNNMLVVRVRNRWTTKTIAIPPSCLSQI